MKNKTLPSIRISDQTLENLKSAILLFNKRNFVKLSIQEFRRLAYELFAQTILQNKEISVKFE